MFAKQEFEILPNYGQDLLKTLSKKRLKRFCFAASHRPFNKVKTRFIAYIHNRFLQWIRARITSHALDETTLQRSILSMEIWETIRCNANKPWLILEAEIAADLSDSSQSRENIFHLTLASLLRK